MEILTHANPADQRVAPQPTLPSDATFVSSFADASVTHLVRTCQAPGCNAKVILTNDEDVFMHCSTGYYNAYFSWECECGRRNEILSVCLDDAQRGRCSAIIEEIKVAYAGQRISVPESAIRSAFARY